MSSDPQQGEEDFTTGERRTLALWRAPSPPPGFADRVLARARAEGAWPGRPTSSLQGVAVAAVALLLVGGFFTFWSMRRTPGPGADPAGYAADGGTRPEVRLPDGTGEL